MIRSMTGFARRERQFPWGLLAWELKTVNHRFLEVGCRLPEEFARRGGIPPGHRGAVRRGKVECSLHFRPGRGAGALEVDASCSRADSRSARSRSPRRPAPAARIDVLDLLRWPGVVRDATRDIPPDDRRRAALLAEALAELARFRDSEGGRLREALEQRCAG
jgi:uncharacterized protein (TIGR00255 family)